MSEKGELLMSLEQIERNKKINKEDILAVVENALISAYRKHVGKNVNVEAKVSPDTGQMTASVVKVVVEDVANPLLEISLEDARKINKEIEVGQEVRIQLDTQNFSRVAAQIAKHVIVQKIKESERWSLFEEMKGKIGQIVSGVVYRIAGRSLIIDLGKSEAILPGSEQVFNERFNLGQHIKVIVMKVEKNSKGSRVILSRASGELVKRLFELEIPEIYGKVVEIVSVVREPGMRTKIAVLSHNSKVDPVGACVGIRGGRIKPIIDELRGEKIDLIPYSLDTAKYIAGSLSPAKIISVKIVSENEKKAEVLVSDDMLSLAIGKKGHNVRLAVKLTGWHIDVKTEKQKKEEIDTKIKQLTDNFSELEGISEKIIETLVNSGFTNIEKLSLLNIKDLTTLPGIGKKTAEKIIKAAEKSLSK